MGVRQPSIAFPNPPVLGLCIDVSSWQSAYGVGWQAVCISPGSTPRVPCGSQDCGFGTQDVLQGWVWADLHAPELKVVTGACSSG